MSKSRKQQYDEKIRQPESEAHHLRRATQRQLDDILDSNVFDLDDEEWEEIEGIARFEKIRRGPQRKFQ